MNILVTGCAGFIGSHMVDLLLSEDFFVVGVDILSYAAKIENLQSALKNKNFNFVVEDINNKEAVREICKSHNIKCIINFAAETHVDNSIENCENFIKANISGVVNLLEVCRSLSVSMLHVSTDEVYGPAHSKFKELDSLNPKNPYAASKAAAEHFIKSYANTYKVEFKIVRPSNNFGPRQHLEKFIPKVVDNIANNIKIPIYGDGKQKREWIYVEDTTRAILVVLLNGLPNQTYNITSSLELENLNVVEEVALLMGVDHFKSAYEYVEDRPGHDRRYLVDSSKLNDLGWRCKHTFKEGLVKTVKSYKAKNEK
jgi:dTDP-glucose 4,6-dehydratase